MPPKKPHTTEAMRVAKFIAEHTGTVRVLVLAYGPHVLVARVWPDGGGREVWVKQEGSMLLLPDVVHDDERPVQVPTHDTRLAVRWLIVNNRPA